MVRFQFEDARKKCPGFCFLTLLQREYAEVVDGLRVGGGESKGLFEGLLRFFFVLKVIEGQAHIEPGRRKFGVDAEAGFQIAEGAVVLRDLNMIGAQVVIYLVVVGEDLQCLI